VGELPAGTCARSARPTSPSAAIAGPFKAASSAARPRKRKLEPERDCTASATFSSAEKRGSTELTWNDRANPSLARASTGMPVMSRPPNSTVPESGAISPEIWLIQRGFSGAIRPDDGVQLTRHDIERQVVGDDEGTERLAQLLEAQHRLRHA